jgi:hypothetical protein
VDRFFSLFRHGFVADGSGLHGVVDRREDGDDHDGYDDQLEMVADERDLIEEKAGHGEEDDPEDAAGDAEADEAGEGHLADAGDEGGEGANDGDEPRHDDGFAAVLFVEPLRFQQIFSVQEPRGRAAEDRRADVKADGVVEQIAAVGGEAEQGEDQGEMDGRVRRCRQGPYREEERIAGEDGRDDQAGLAEDDQGQQTIDADLMSGREGVQVLVEMKKKVESLMNQGFILARRGRIVALGGGRSSAAKFNFNRRDAKIFFQEIAEVTEGEFSVG